MINPKSGASYFRSVHTQNGGIRRAWIWILDDVQRSRFHTQTKRDLPDRN